MVDFSSISFGIFTPTRVLQVDYAVDGVTTSYYRAFRNIAGEDVVERLTTAAAPTATLHERIVLQRA